MFEIYRTGYFIMKTAAAVDISPSSGFMSSLAAKNRYFSICRRHFIQNLHINMNYFNIVAFLHTRAV
ncbi:hypothetical protein D0T90_03555 [Neisseria animalis]|uniref:Uncharacterized protein n=1 Tax=Neisseria animalis TaxID=492 RepID=A0A5P3MQ66_NEIAN|nr:hypothetical protein D0T90_03555 [Neisseria animalis]ROW32837.1 hypothetical protein CGZ60_03175 [Neisseria animalis]